MDATSETAEHGEEVCSTSRVLARFGASGGALAHPDDRRDSFGSALGETLKAASNNSSKARPASCCMLRSSSSPRYHERV